MKYFVPIVLAIASSANAISTCENAAVLESCLGTATGAQQQCPATDWNCLCSATSQKLQCYASSGCTDDEGAIGAESEMKAYCAFVTTTSVQVPTATPTSDSTATSAEVESSSTTSASTGAENDDTNSGAYLAMNAGGMLFAVAGVVAAIL